MSSRFRAAAGRAVVAFVALAVGASAADAGDGRRSGRGYRAGYRGGVGSPYSANRPTYYTGFLPTGLYGRAGYRGPGSFYSYGVPDYGFGAYHGGYGPGFTSGSPAYGYRGYGYR